jgi:hypothetical protein
VAERVLEQATTEAVRARREAAASSRRPLLLRLLAASVAVHVVVLGLLAVLSSRPSGGDGGAPVPVALALPEARGEDPWVEDPAEGLADLGTPWAVPSGIPLPADPGRLPDPLVPGAWVHDEGLVPLPERMRSHPAGTALLVLPRLSAAAKASRLERFGYQPSGTLATVERGLKALVRRQGIDGDFAPGSGRGPVGQTSLALLAFLGDGHGTSGDGAFAPFVRRAVGFVRRAAFDPSGAIAGDLATHDAAIALKALSEDYVLSYGALAPADARRRAEEIRALAAAVVAAQRPDGSFPGAQGVAPDWEKAVWPMWALDAATRSGVLVPPARVAERYAAWLGTRARGGASEGLAAATLLLARDLGEGVRPEALRDAAASLAAGGRPADPFVAAAASTGLFLSDPAAFAAWSRTSQEALLDAVLPTGVVAGADDEVGDTALHLLALQAAYRTW